MAKTVEDLRKSRENKAKLKLKWDGFIPTTIWDVNYSLDGGIFKFGKTQTELGLEAHKKRITEGGIDQSTIKSAFKMSGATIRGKGKGLKITKSNPPS